MSDWACFVRYYSEDVAGSVVVDLDVSPDVAEGLVKLVRATLFLRDADDQGFPGDKEDEELVAVEDQFEQMMLQEFGGTYVGRVTVQGKRILHAYLPDSAHMPASLELQGGYRAEIEVFADAEWDMFYSDLFPAPDEYQVVMNHRMIEQLKEGGEDLSIPRETDHLALFDNKEDADAYCAETLKLGFKVRKTGENENRFLVQVYRTQSVSSDEIDQVTLELLDLAESHSGVYDGWETFLLNAPDEPPVQ